MMKTRLIMPICLALAGCATPRAEPPAGPDPRVVAQIVSMAAAQVKRCYQQPRLGRSARQIVTTLRVRFTADGMLAGLPLLVGQGSITPENRAYAGQMAEAARTAIIRCQPYRLPAELYQGGWDEFELTFSPRAIA